MGTQDWIRMLLSILSGVAVCIPLVVALIRYVQKAVKEKNWKQLLDMVVELMKTAEEMFDAGADRKQWVLEMVQASADHIEFDIDMDVVGGMIDDLCAMSKVVNPPLSAASEAEEAGA